MKAGWMVRQIVILTVLAAVLILISGMLELANVVRLASEGAATESELITHTLRLQIEQVVAEGRVDPAQAIKGDRRIAAVLQAATEQAPSVVFVAICDTNGVALAHTTPDMVGRTMDVLPQLPRSHSFGRSLAMLVNLRSSPPVYGFRTPLRLHGAPFATIRVGIAGGLLRERVDSVFHRGILAAGLQLALAILVGFVLAGVVRGRLRELEAGVTALREGRFGSKIRESGIDEFSRLARDLNLLSEQFAKEQRGPDRNLRQAVDLLGDGILTLGPRGEVVLVNAPAEKTLGIRANSVGSSLQDVLPDSHPVRRLAERLYHDEARSLSVALPSNGSGSAHVAVGHRILGHDGPGGVLIEIKRTEALRELHSLVDHSRVLARLGQMAAGVAHEIRNPLQTINLELGILRGAQDLGADEIREHVETAMEGIERLQRAVTGFLRVARLQRMSFAEIAPCEFLQELKDAHESEANLAGLDLDLEITDELPVFNGDREVLRQALQNLVRNSIQAQPSREGRVILRGSHESSECLCFSVEDTGPGIPPQQQEKVFDLYFTTKEGGTGVGLALVRQAVEMHNGAVELVSQPGEGTTVTLRLPIRPVHGEV